MTYGQFWFDIETNPSPGCAWSSQLSLNCAYMSRLIAAATRTGRSFGVYASHYEWEHVMDLSCTTAAGVPLWNAAWDGQPTGGFAPFGGWAEQAMKQYNGTGQLCGREVDFDGYA